MATSTDSSQWFNYGFSRSIPDLLSMLPDFIHFSIEVQAGYASWVWITNAEKPEFAITNLPAADYNNYNVLDLANWAYMSRHAIPESIRVVYAERHTCAIEYLKGMQI